MAETPSQPSSDKSTSDRTADARAAIAGRTGMDRLCAIMATLRDPDMGCPWDGEQSFATIAPYTIEEAYEVADAIHRDDMADLCGELGDLLLQVVYHAQMAEERGAFTLADVIETICGKMVRRHPHVFGDGGPSPGWEQIKSMERERLPDQSALAGVAHALPALARAEKLQKRASNHGFDWPDARGPRAKIDEELCEVDQATTAAAQADEIGDVLFSVVNWARHLGVDAEQALTAANRKFERRFRSLEAQAKQPLTAMTIDELEALWTVAKTRD